MHSGNVRLAFTLAQSSEQFPSFKGQSNQATRWRLSVSLNYSTTNYSKASSAQCTAHKPRLVNTYCTSYSHPASRANLASMEPSAPQRDRRGRINPNWARQRNVANRRAGMATGVLQAIDPVSEGRQGALAGQTIAERLFLLGTCLQLLSDQGQWSSGTHASAT